MEQLDLFDQTIERQAVRDLTEGQRVDTCLALTHLSLRPYSKGHFLQMKLGDRTGRIAAVMWDNAEETYRLLKTGDLVAVKGQVKRYQDKPQIQVEQMAPHPGADQFDPLDFLPAAELDTAQLWAELQSLLDQVVDPDIRCLLDCFYQDQPLVEAFVRAPGGKQWHHGYLGGLLEHTLGVVRNCVQLAVNYPYLDLDILLAGALFHDLGKVFEYDYRTAIDYTDLGRLVGHQVISDQQVCRYAASLTDFPPERLLQLRHLLLAHHGDVEDAVRRPQTREALVLSRADDLDAQLNAFSREIIRARKNDRQWSDYVKLIGRYIYATGEPDNETYAFENSDG